MQSDLELVQLMLENKILPTIRFYSWEPYAISIGYHQEIDSINVKKCKADKIDVIRRPTGGSAVFHAEELTYSVVVPIIDFGVQEVFQKIGRILVDALNEFGINANCVNNQLQFYSQFENGNSYSCFNSTSKNEIQYEGKKIIGSAQRLFKNENGNKAILQHGSILIGKKYLEINNYLFFNSKDEKNKQNNLLLNNTTCLNSICKRLVEYEEVKKSLKISFKKNWGINFEEKLEWIADREINLQLT